MYIIKADGVEIYNPASDDSATKVLEPRAKFKLNKTGSLEFTMLPDNVMYGRLQRMKSVVTLEQDGKIIFQGRVLDTVTDIDRHINVYCEGALGYLMDSAVRPYTYEGGAASLFYQLVAQHNAQVDGYKQFSVGTVTAASGETLTEYDSDSCANTLNEIKQMLVDPYGGYLRVRYSGGSKYLDYIDAYGTSSGQTLEYGVNMVAMEDAYELGNIYSVLVPLGAYYTEEDKKEEEEGGEEEVAALAEGEETEDTEGETPEEEVDETIGEDGLKKKLKIAGVVTIESVNGGSDYLIDSDMLSKYGRVVKAHRWENVDDPQELMDKGLELLERNKDARSIKLRAVDLHVINASVDTIELGDNVRLVSNPHGLSLTDICSAIDLDIENPEYTEYTFGIAPETLTEQNASASRRASYQSSSFLRWLTETDTSLNIAVQNVDLINGKLTQVGIDVDALEGAVTIWADQIDNLVTQTAELMVKYDEIVATVENNSGQISQLRLDVDSITAKVEDAEGKIAALELSLSDLEAKVVLKAEYETDKNAMLTLISNNEESIATLAAQHGERLAALELYTSDLESRVLLKAEYEENRKADLQLIANAEESIATLEAAHEGRLAALELKTNDLESSVVLKAEYDENREADLQLISNAQESIATLETKYDSEIASLTLRADEQGSMIEAKADLILLEGYVKASDLETEVLEVLESANIYSLTVTNLNAYSVSGVSATFDNVSAEWFTMGGSIVATEDWVLEQGFLTSAPGGYATQSWVIEQGYATSADVAETLTNFVMRTELDGYATEAWVEDQGYLTEVPTGYATEEWVAENFSKASATYKPTVIERYGSLSGTSIPVRALNESGTVLLTGTVSAGDVYSNGASSVTLSGSGWSSGSFTVRASNGKTYAVSHPTVTLSGGTTWNASHQTTVYAYSNAQSGYLTYKTIDASSVYDDGYEAGADSVTLSEGEWSSNKKTITASNGKTLEVDASNIYNAGSSAGFNGGYNLAITGAIVELDGTTVRVYSPDGGIAGPTLDISSNLTASYNSGYADATPASVSRVATYVSTSNSYTLTATVTSADGAVKTFTLAPIDASGPYNAGKDAGYIVGYDAAVESATITCEGANAVVTFSDGTKKTLDLTPYVTVTGGISAITNPAQNYYRAEGWANALINGTQVDYTTFSKAQQFSG